MPIFWTSIFSRNRNVAMFHIVCGLHWHFYLLGCECFPFFALYSVMHWSGNVRIPYNTIVKPGLKLPHKVSVCSSVISHFPFILEYSLPDSVLIIIFDLLLVFFIYLAINWIFWKCFHYFNELIGSIVYEICRFWDNLAYVVFLQWSFKFDWSIFCGSKANILVKWKIEFKSKSGTWIVVHVSFLLNPGAAL